MFSSLTNRPTSRALTALVVRALDSFDGTATPGSAGGISGVPVDGASPLAHPHRRPLGRTRPRRPGRVASRPQPCLTPLPSRAERSRARAGH